MTDPLFPMIACERLRMTTDGEGVTTLVAAQGCPLRCRYCLNPHSWNGKAKIRNVTPQALYDLVRIDSLYFIATGGGVTFGGGEPLTHAAFIAAFRERCEREWHLNAETSLQISSDALRTAIGCIDTFIVDVKDMHAETYRAYTGREIAPMLENLERLIDAVGAERIVARVPLIPNFNDESAVDESVAALTEIGISKIDRFNYIVKT